MHADTPPTPSADEPLDSAPLDADREARAREPMAEQTTASATVAAGVSSPASTGTASFDGALREEALRAANRTGGGFTVRALAWEWMKVVPLAFVCFLLVKSLLVEAYKIPSGSMEHTLLPGDFLLVNKLVYGATLPFTHTKLPALRTPARGDIVVFEWPVDRTKNFVKRLVALPGDTVAMRAGRLVLNGVEQDERYAIRSEPGADPIAAAFRWQRGYLVRTAAASGSQNASSVPGVETASAAERPEWRSRRYRPSRNNWGPLVVPAGQYFVLGDNRDNSLDSRYWGFVPDSLVVGTPLVVYYSFTPDSTVAAPWLSRVRWDRLGTRIR